MTVSVQDQTAIAQDHAPAAPGLVRCAVTRDGSWTDVEATVTEATLSQLRAYRPRFPSPELVAAAAREFLELGLALPVWDGHEGPRARVVVAPGAVAVRRHDLARRERAAERAAAALRKRVEELAAYVEEHGELPSKPLPVNKITRWSRKSRRTFRLRMCELDYRPLLHSGATPAMVTLTYPGDWQTVAPTGKAAKRHLQMFRRRFRDAWGTSLIAVWKLEFQLRGAPHFHLFMVPPHGTSHDGRALPFRAWLSTVWADIVDHPDPQERARHRAAGTGIDYAAGLRARDPQRIADYFAKHGTAGAKEYQHDVPELWQAPGAGPGRFWGYWGLKPVRAAAELPEQTAQQLVRTMRRYAHAQGVTHEVRVPRTAGGGIRLAHWSDREVVGLAGAQLVQARHTRFRRVRRRVRRMRGGAGWLMVNDGPGFVQKLARFLHQLVDRAAAAVAPGFAYA